MRLKILQTPLPPPPRKKEKKKGKQIKNPLQQQKK